MKDLNTPIPFEERILYGTTVRITDNLRQKEIIPSMAFLYHQRDTLRKESSFKRIRIQNDICKKKLIF